MSTWAAPGVKCVRIREISGRVNDLGIRECPAVGEICTIAAVAEKDIHGIGIYLVGYSSRQWFQVTGFAPLAYPKQSLESDIAIFTKIADRVPAPKRRVKA